MSATWCSPRVTSHGESQVACIPWGTATAATPVRYQGGMSEETGACTALVVPVAAADWLVRGRSRLPAHVPLLAPFLRRSAVSEGLLAELRTLFADVVPF